MTKKGEFWFLSLALISTRLMDIVLTYRITPDLKYEANPLVQFAGLGWSILLLVNLFVVFACILLLVYSKTKNLSLFPKQKGYHFKEFVSHYLYNEKSSFYKIYFIVPYNRSAIVHFYGYLLVRTLITWSLCIVVHNFSLLTWETYRAYIVSYNAWMYLYLLLLPLTLFFFWKFFYNEFQTYRSLS
ncbi:MAG: hypothetical protein AAF518_13650 [Spirochaetota bacterium]